MTTSHTGDIVHACAVVDQADTRYRSAGRGECVIVLAASGSASSLLLTMLPRHLRVIAPEMHVKSSADEEFDVWLRGFLDALGIQSASFISDSEFAAALLVFAVIDPARVNGIVFASGTASFDGAPMATLSADAAALLVTPSIFISERLSASVVDKIATFVDGLALEP